jgi:hypothetical protein
MFARKRCERLRQDMKTIIGKMVWGSGRYARPSEATFRRRHINSEQFSLPHLSSWVIDANRVGHKPSSRLGVTTIRTQVITLLAGAALVWPLAVAAQSTMRPT